MTDPMDLKLPDLAYDWRDNARHMRSVSVIPKSMHVLVRMTDEHRSWDGIGTTAAEAFYCAHARYLNDRECEVIRAMRPECWDSENPQHRDLIERGAGVFNLDDDGMGPLPGWVEIQRFDDADLFENDAAAAAAIAGYRDGVRVIGRAICVMRAAAARWGLLEEPATPTPQTLATPATGEVCTVVRCPKCGGTEIAYSALRDRYTWRVEQGDGIPIALDDDELHFYDNAGDQNPRFHCENEDCAHEWAVPDWLQEQLK